MLLWSDHHEGVIFTRHSSNSSTYASRLYLPVFQGRLRPATALLFAAGRYRRCKAPATVAVKHLQPETIAAGAPCAKHCTMSRWSLVKGHWSGPGTLAREPLALSAAATDQCNSATSRTGL
jgi:hypothetical protein